MEYNLFQKGLDFLEKNMMEHGSMIVTYTNKNESKSIHAVLGKSKYESTKNDGMSVESYVIDFLVNTEELGFEPEKGDVIETDKGMFVVTSLGSEGAHRMSDPYKKFLRIHAKEQ